MPWPDAPFIEALADASGGNKKTPQNAYLATGTLPIVDQGKLPIAGYTDDETCAVRGELPVIVFGDHTRTLKYVNFRFAMGADGVKVLRPREGWSPKYLFHFLKYADLPAAGYSRHFKFLKELHIPKPPIAEQRRIADILDHADALLFKRHESIALLDDLAESIFLDIFGNPLRNERGWPIHKLHELADTTSGGTPDRSVSANFGGDVPWVKSGELHGGVVRSTEETLTAQGLAGSSARLLPPGTILLAMYGATAGAVALLAMHAATNQAVCGISLRPPTQGPYLVGALRLMSSHLLAARTGGAQPNLSQSLIKNLDIPLPPTELQLRYVDALDGLDRTRQRFVEAHAISIQLSNALSQRAFRGKL